MSQLRRLLLRHPTRLAIILTAVVAVTVIFMSAGLIPKVQAIIGLANPQPWTVEQVGTTCTVRLTTFVNDWIGVGGSLVNQTVTITIPSSGDSLTLTCIDGPGGTANTDPSNDGPTDICQTNGNKSFDMAYTGTGGAITVNIPVNTVNPYTPSITYVPNPLVMPNCAPPPPPPPPTAAAEPPPPPPPPLDPPGAPPRVWGGYDQLASPLVVYDTAYGYQFYHYTGRVLGLLDFNSVGIPGPLQLITSMSSEIWRVDVYYMHDDIVQANLYENGALIEEAELNIPGLGGRAGEVQGQPAPMPGAPAGVQVVSAPAQPSAGQVQLTCRQNLRQQASIETAVLTVMDTGHVVNVVGRSNDGSWLEVITGDGIRGWAFNGRCLNIPLQSIQQAPVEVVFESQPTVNPSDALTQQPGAPTVTAVAAPASTGPVVGIVCRQNMRTGPGTGFTVDRVLEPGTNLTVVGRSNDGTWLQVTAGDASGWTYFGQCVLPQAGDVTAAPVTVAFGG